MAETKIKKLKYQVEKITAINGLNTLAEKDFVTDEFYDTVEGIAIYPEAAPGDFSAVPSLLIGITDENGTVQDRTPIADFLSSLAVPIEERYKALNIPAKGNRIRIEFQPTAGALAAEFNFYVVLKLAKYNI